MRTRGVILCAIVLSACVQNGRSPSGSGSCDPTATSDNGCPDGMACTPFGFDEARGEHVAQCEPGGPADEREACGEDRKCRAGHICNIVPNEQPSDPRRPGVCFRLCNVDLPLCPGSSCAELSSAKKQWLTVDGVRLGICGGFRHTRWM